jgi:uncharacterized protein YacL (UPF0231 family)
VKELREEICEMARRTINEYDELDSGEKIRVLSERVSMDYDRVSHALNSEITFNEEQFVSVVSTLQKVRKNL